MDEEAVVAAAFQHLRDGELGQGGAGQVKRIFVVFDLIAVASGGDPAQAQAGRQGFGKGAAVDHATVHIPRFGHAGAMHAEAQIAVDVVFYQRNAACGKPLDQGLFARVRHAEAERVAEVGDHDAGRHGPAFGGKLQRFQRNAFTRMGWNFQRLQAGGFDDLQQAVEGRRFDGNDVAGFADGVQRQGERFLRAAGDDDVFGADVTVQISHASGDLMTQCGIARRERVPRAFSGVFARGGSHGAVDRGDG